MSELSVYFARAMDARVDYDIVADDVKYTALLTSINARLTKARAMLRERLGGMVRR